MALRLERGADALGFLLELRIMMKMNDMDHLMLKRILNLIGKEKMIFASDLDKFVIGGVGSGAPHTAGVFNFGTREFPCEIGPVKAVEHGIQLFNRWQGRRSILLFGDGCIK